MIALRLIALLLLALTCGCRTPTRTATIPRNAHLKVLTYNVNYAGFRPEHAAEIIALSGADIVCLQETTAEFEQALRFKLWSTYPVAQYRESRSRLGGGFGFLSKIPAHEIAFVPSDTGWFDGWIMKFQTALGPLQVINVHLRPPISDGGSWVSGYFTTRTDRRLEMEKFFAARDLHLPTLVVGDFNDHEQSEPIRWLEAKGLTNALPQFDRYRPTWNWKTGLVTLERRLDHILYSPEFDCTSARVLSVGDSDHFPVEATFVKAN